MFKSTYAGDVTDDDPRDERWLDDGQLRDWRSLVGLVMTLPAALDAQLKRDTGLNMFEYHVLAALSEAPHEALPMSDLAVLAQGSPSRLSHAVSRLEGSGWVERRACAEAGRRTAAHLTPAGRAQARGGRAQSRPGGTPPRRRQAQPRAARRARRVGPRRGRRDRRPRLHGVAV